MDQVLTIFVHLNNLNVYQPITASSSILQKYLGGDCFSNDLALSYYRLCQLSI